MADTDQLTDAEIVAELQEYGEKVQLPFAKNKRPIFVKKLNHLRARNKPKGVPSGRSAGKQSKPTPAPIRRRQEQVLDSRSNSADRSVSTRRSPVDLVPNNYSSSWSRTEMLRTRSRAGPSHLEALSSDDSDTEMSSSNTTVDLPRSVALNRSDAQHANSQERKRTPQLADNILRTVRRRTAELSPRRQESEVFELSTENERDVRSRPIPPTWRRSMKNDDDIDIVDTRSRSRSRNERDEPSSSSIKSRLYPDLSRFTSSFLSRSRDDTKDNFESSDSDLDASTYEVENKSVNTSFPSYHNRTLSPSASTGRVNLSSQSLSPSLRNSTSSRVFPWRRGASLNSPRVPQYKSALTEHLPHFFIAIAMLFFVTLSVAYVTNHRDYFFSWLSTPSYRGSNDQILLCLDGLPAEGCYDQVEIDKALGFITELFSELSTKKGQVLCETARPGEEIIKASNLQNTILKTSVAKTNAVRLYECCLDHILANPHWKLRALREDGSVATASAEIAKFDSEVADMTFKCRLMRSFTTVLYGIFLVIAVIAGMVLVSMYVKYRLQRQELEQREVYTMVEKIIDILQDHHEQTKGEDSDEPPYLAVQHVRDQILPPAQRRKLQPIWDKAVDFIAANESRIRLEIRLIHGDEFEVWHWLQPSTHNGKIWQGQAFGETNDNSSNQIYSPTPCLKIRNMFDSNVESEENWEDKVTDALLEKCKSIEDIVHIFVDVDSREGCVYMKCSSCEAAGKTRVALHGWWFDGRLVTVKHLKTDHYHKRWPEARGATKPLKPSTNQMQSLSQPFYRSSLEMT